MKDSKGNLIKVTLFESYLSKYLIESDYFFEPLYQKILSALHEVEALNEENPVFNRIMYSMMSLLKTEHGYNSIEELKTNFNLFATNYFIKLFCDHVFNNEKLTIILPTNKVETEVPSFASLCKATLRKNQTENQTTITQLRNPAFFDKENRGVLEVDNKIIRTKKLGITTLSTTPKILLNYFKQQHEPSQFFYKPNLESSIGKWLRRHNLPIISGASGSGHDSLTLIFSLLSPTREEVQLLMIALAATLIAKGHHSYFETIILLSQCDFELKSTETLFEFYKQTLPVLITSSASYLEFEKSPRGQELLDGLKDKMETTLSIECLPELSIEPTEKESLLSENSIFSTRGRSPTIAAQEPETARSRSGSH